MSEDVPDAYRDFVWDAANREDCDASVEGNGEIHVKTTAHDSDESIAFDTVCSLAHSHGLSVVGGAGFFDDGVVLVKVASEGWQSGGGEE